MKLKFEGVVVLGDGNRVADDEINGSAHVGEWDVVGEIYEYFNKKDNLTIGIANETFSGELFVEYGWGYSEYTPMECDSLVVDDKNLLDILSNHENKHITMWVSDEPINILED